MHTFSSLNLIYHSQMFFGTVSYDVNRCRSIREEHVIKEHCGQSGIMGYVTFHHKTRRGPLAVT